MKANGLPVGVDLKGKVAVVTGAGGVICSMLAEALAAAGAKVALLDLNGERAEEFAKQIVKDGGVAKGYSANVLNKQSLADCHKQVLNDLGKCDILVNGAGGNNPKAQTDKEYFENGFGRGRGTVCIQLKLSGYASSHAGICARYGRARGL